MKTSKGTGVAVAAVLSVLLAAFLVFASVAYFPSASGSAKTSLTTSVETSFTTLTTFSTLTQQYLSNGNFSVIAPSLASTPCAKPVKSEPLGFTLEVNSKSPALLCVAYYYYNDSVPFHLIPATQIRIFGWPLNPSGTFTTFDASSNFTITSSVPSFELGGPTNLNEGREVTYRIQAEPGVNGTFEVGLANLLPGGIGCGSDFLLSAGTGVPNYARAELCYLVPFNPSSSLPLTPEYLFVALIGATNSTS